MKSQAKKIVLAAKYILRLARGMVYFLRKGTTPNDAYQSLIQLFCLTGGVSNDLLSRAVALRHRPYKLETTEGVLGTLSATAIVNITSALQRDGYHVFTQKLSSDVCDRLMTFALSQEAIVRPMDKNTNGIFGDVKCVYDPEAPLGIIYQFEQSLLVNQPDIQALMIDTSLIAVAQSYIGSKPVLDEVNVWWTTFFGRNPDSNAAQLYHFDMDRIRWLKFFFYLTDVGPDNGPHCFVARSHSSGGIPSDFLGQGYARIADRSVRDYYPEKQLIEFTGLQGTIIAEDTRGLHKGRPVSSGHRLVLEFEFSNSLFGAMSPHRVDPFRNYSSQKFKEFVEGHPRIYENWLS